MLLLFCFLNEESKYCTFQKALHSTPELRYEDTNPGCRGTHIMFIIPDAELIAYNCQAALIMKRQTIWG